jgi:peptidoglycan-associated lipoprotein
MRRVLVTVAALASLFLAGCPAKPRNGECKSSDDCKDQQGFGKVCVEGRCQECASDKDCKDGFVCRTNKCVPRPECAKDADCGEGKKCEGERCVAARDEAAEAEAERRRKAAEEEAARAALAKECGDLAAFTIRFGFDQSTLTGDAPGTLQKLAECLKKAAPKRVLVQGHTDERGTTQYNIALGARRAEAARKYLADLGVGVKMETVSFGKEKPLCTESTEECWARNRRAEFQVER